MTGRVIVLRPTIALGLVVLVGAACGGTSHSAPSHWAPPKAVEVSAVAGAPGRFVREPLQSEMTPNPDPRGPCGGRLDQPSLTNDGLTPYTSASGTEVFLWSRHLPRRSVQKLVDAVSADIHPGCPSFLSRTPYAHDQVNEFLGAVSLPALGDQRVAFATRVRQDAPGSRWAYAAEAFVRDGDRLSAIMVVSTQRPDDAFVRGVTALASG